MATAREFPATTGRSRTEGCAVPLWKRIAVALERPIMLFFKRHADYMTRMAIRARVLDARTGEGLAGVKATLLDDSFDQHRKRDPDKHALLVGESGPDGVLDETLEYLWSRDIVWLMKTRQGERFRVRFSREGYAPETREFDARRLPIEDHVLQVDVGDVQLESQSPAPTASGNHP
jgi:hypothetical protein